MARCGGARRVGLGDVLAQVGPEVVPAVADRLVRAEEADERVQIPTVRVRPRSAWLVSGPGPARSARRARPWCDRSAPTERRSTGVPVSSAGLMSGRAPRSSWVAPLRSTEKAARSRRNGRWTANERMPSSRLGGDLEIVAFSASRIARERLEGRRHVGEQLGVHAGDGGDDARRVSQLLEEAPDLGARVRQVAGDGLEVLEGVRQRFDQRVDVAAPAREGVAEDVEVVGRGLPRGLVEDLVDVVELNRDLGLGDRDRVPVLELGLRGPSREVDVLRVPAPSAGGPRSCCPTGSFRPSCPASGAAGRWSARPSGLSGSIFSTTPTRKPP